MTTPDEKEQDALNSTSSPPESVPKSKWRALVITVLVLLALGAGGWSAFYFGELLTRKIQYQAEQTQILNDRVDGLAKELEALARSPSETELFSLLTEVEYLVRAADYRFRFFQDTAATEALLDTASQRISQFSDSQLDMLQEKIIAKRFEVLQMAPFDATAMTLKINQIIHALEGIPTVIAHPRSPPLPLKPDLPNSEPTGEARSFDRQMQLWREGLQHTWEKLKHLIVIKRQDTTVKPFLLPQERALVLWNIRFELEQAKLALWRGDETTYRSSINQAMRWLREHFNARGMESVGPIKGELEALSQVAWPKQELKLGELIDAIRTARTQRQTEVAS